MPLPAPLKYNSVRDRLFRCPRFVKLSTAGNKLKFKLQQVTYSVHELVISHRNMEKIIDFLGNPTSAYFTNSISFMSVKCNEDFKK